MQPCNANTKYLANIGTMRCVYNSHKPQPALLGATIMSVGPWHSIGQCYCLCVPFHLTWCHLHKVTRYALCNYTPTITHVTYLVLYCITYVIQYWFFFATSLVWVGVHWKTIRIWMRMGADVHKLAYLACWIGIVSGVVVLTSVQESWIHYLKTGFAGILFCNTGVLAKFHTHKYKCRLNWFVVYNHISPCIVQVLRNYIYMYKLTVTEQLDCTWYPWIPPWHRLRRLGWQQ